MLPVTKNECLRCRHSLTRSTCCHVNKSLLFPLNWIEFATFSPYLDCSWLAEKFMWVSLLCSVLTPFSASKKEKLMCMFCKLHSTRHTEFKPHDGRTI